MRKFFRPVPLAVAAVTFMLIYTLVGFFLIPYLIKAYVFPKVSEQLQRPVFAKEVEVNPFVLSLRLTGFEIQEQDTTPLIGFEEFFFNFQAISLIRRAYVFDTIRFGIPFVSVRVAKGGRVNLADLVPASESTGTSSPPQGPETKSEIPAVQIGHFEIAQGVVEFRDETKSKPFSMDIVPINIVLNNFHTKPGGDNTYAFTAELGKGETLSWEGTVSIEPIQSEGKLSLAGLKLPVLWQYMQEGFRFSIADGTLSADGKYRLDAGVSPPEMLIADTSVQVADLAITEHGGLDPVIMIPSFKVEGIQLDVRKRAVAVSSVSLTDAVWTTWLNADGTVNYQSLFAPANPDVSASASVQTSPAPIQEPPWTVTLQEAGIKNHTIHFEDRSLRSVAYVEITELSARTHDVTVPIKGAIPLSLELTINQTGRMKVDGQVAVEPFKADLALGLKQIAIKPFEPYLEPFARAAVESGDVDLDGDLHVAIQYPNTPSMTYRGNLGLRGLAVTNLDDGSPLLSWKQLQLKQIDLAIDPTVVTIEEVGLDQPVVHLAVLSDGQVNLNRVRPQTEGMAPASPAEKPVAAKKTAPASVAIKTVKLLKGSALFQDQSIQPVVRTGIYDLTGTIKGLSSQQVAKADVAISGRVDKVAPLKIAGTINPLSQDAFTDLSIKFDNVDLTTATSYSGKYAGYPIQKGKLFLDLAYKISKKQLEAENKVAIDQLTFGEKTNSPDATSLPVPLAVALLKDRKGRIDIDLPIRGDLSDPDFKYGKVVISTLLNLLTKLVTSPFALVGKLVPGGEDGEDLQYFAFAPGSAASLADELKKADALTTALAERPGLRLEITGTADPVRDRRAIGLQKLAAQVRAMWNQEQGNVAMNAEPIPTDEEQRLIKDLYDQQHRQTAGTQAARQSDPPSKPPALEEMKQELVASMLPDNEALRALAQQRAEEIRTQLTGEGKLTAERIYMTDVDLTAADHEQVRSRLAISAQ